MSEKKSKIDKLAEQQEVSDCSANLEEAENCRAKEDQPTEEELVEIQARAEENAELAGLLARKQCIHCGQKACWAVTKTDGKVRYLRCKGCSNPDKVATK